MKRLILVLSIISFSLQAKSENRIGGNGMKTMVASGATYFLVNAAINKYAESKFTKICTLPSGGQWACPLAAAAGVGLLMSAKGAKKSHGIEGDLGCANTNTCFEGGNNGSFGNNNLNPNDPIDREIVRLERDVLPRVERNIKDLEKKGYKVNPDGSVSMPNGSTLSGTSPSAMRAAGMSDEQIQQAVDTMELAKKERESLLSQLNEYDEEYAGGGGPNGGSNAYESSSANSDDQRFGARLPTDTRNDPSVAGLSVNHGGDSIGVSADNLFEMIHRKYKEKRPSMANPNGP